MKCWAIIGKGVFNCKDNIENTDLTNDIEDCFKFNDFNDYELLGKKELSQEIFNVINKGLNDSKN